MTELTVTTANICANPVRPMSVVEARMEQAAEQPGVVFGQEIDRGTYDKAWDSIMRGEVKTTFNQTTECPISIPSGRDIETEIVRVHTGLAHVSPNRIISVAKDTTNKVAYLNCHPVSKPRLGVPSARWRIDRWNDYHRALVAKVAELHADGYTVVFGGDMNKHTVPRVHALQRTLASSGLDHLWVVPGPGLAVSGIRSRAIPRTRLMDHPILTANFTVSPGDSQPEPGAPPKRPAARPVPRPWRRRSRRWKRLHKNLWRRILAWRKKHPRRRHR